MNNPPPLAGGFFLILPIVIGFVWGVATGLAMQGAIVGLGIGVVLLVIVTLVDRFRHKR